MILPRVILTSTFLCAFVPFALAVPLGAQDSARRPPARVSAPGAIPIASLAGQTVAVLPITLVTADSVLKQDTLYAKYRDRGGALAWADSIVGAALVERGPEVQWVLPAKLRHIARRSPGMVKDPDELGQAVLRSPPRQHKEVPEPLRAELRNLVAVSGGRVVLVPAALRFGRNADGPSIRADLTLVLVDVRAGKVLWYSVVPGSGATPSAALDAALAVAVPLDSASP